jgi:hypothetical protein
MAWQNERIEIGRADQKMIQKASANALKGNLPFSGILMKSTISPFAVPSAGQVTAHLTVDGEEMICGS